MEYTAKADRYKTMSYNRCGKSGLRLPAMSFGLWHNFGSSSDFPNAREMVLGAFDMGITHFDLANNYGPPEGSAEESFGKILHDDLKQYRDEMIVATKAGYYMWPGPYGDGGSKKYLTASLDQSLTRMGLDYVDIYYHHRPDSETPLEETMEALASLVRQGKALYIGLSNYGPKELDEAAAMLKEWKTPCVIHQHRYSMLCRENERLQPVLEDAGIGSIAFCPLEQGILTNKYLNGIPADSRAAGHSAFLSKKQITPELVEKVDALNKIASERGQSLAQMALVWALDAGKLTSVILGASRLAQLEENAAALKNQSFTEDEKKRIDKILQK